MSRDVWFKADPTDWLEGLEQLPDEGCVAVYCVVLLRIYQSAGSIPFNPEAIAIHARMSRTKTARALDRLVASGKLYLDGDRLMNGRALDELKARAKVSEKRSIAGAAGGRANRKQSENLPTSDKVLHETGQKLVRSAEVSTTGMAENSDGAEAIAQAERKKERKNSPTPHSIPARQRTELDLIPLDDGVPLSPEAKREAIDAISDIVDRPSVDGEVIRLATGRVMQIANMVVPPMDLVLVGSWVKLGMDPEADIYPIVTRLAAGARGPIRGMRYFDAEIRRVHEHKTTADDASIAEFRKIAQRNSGGRD